MIADEIKTANSIQTLRDIENRLIEALNLLADPTNSGWAVKRCFARNRAVKDTVRKLVLAQYEIWVSVRRIENEQAKRPEGKLNG